MAGLTMQIGWSDRHCMAGLTDPRQELGGTLQLIQMSKLIVNSDICARKSEVDCRIPLMEYLKDPSFRVDRKFGGGHSNVFCLMGVESPKYG